MCEGCKQGGAGVGTPAPTSQDHIREYGWEWFRYHAEQRTSMFNYSIAAASLLAAGFVAAIDKHANVAAPIAFFGAWITWSFILIDGRNDKLVRRGERVLKALEVTDFPNVMHAPAANAGHTMPGGILIVDDDGIRTDANDPFLVRYWRGTHRVHLRLIQGSFCAAFLLGGCFATLRPDLFQTKEPPVAENIKILSDQVSNLSASLKAVTAGSGNAVPNQSSGASSAKSSSVPAPTNPNDRR
jgi:hypothetical protein